MPFKFTVPPAFANVSIGAGGRPYTFTDCELMVEDLADAKRIRLFAVETPHVGVTEDGAAIEPEPKPEPESTGFLRDEDAEVEAEVEAEEPQLERLNRAALVELAAGRDIATEGLTKAEIRSVLEG